MRIYCKHRAKLKKMSKIRPIASKKDIFAKKFAYLIFLL